MINRRNMGLAASAVAMAAAGGTLVSPAAAQGQRMTLLQVLQGSRDLSIFAGLVKTADVEGELTKPGNFGFFIPHDPFFGGFAAPSMQELTADKQRLRAFVLNHVTTTAPNVYPGGFGSENSPQAMSLTTLSGRSVSLWNGQGGVPRIEGHLIYVANLPASNGVAHCINGLITL